MKRIFRWLRCAFGHSLTDALDRHLVAYDDLGRPHKVSRCLKCGERYVVALYRDGGV